MENFIKFDMAVELIANQISNFNIKQQDNQQLVSLMEDREKIYQGDSNTVDKIIDLYGKKETI